MCVAHTSSLPYNLCPCLTQADHWSLRVIDSIISSLQTHCVFRI
jgi:hypothetical protein